MAENKQLRIFLSLPSTMQLIYLLDTVISDLLREMKFNEEAQEHVNLAVIEAGTNAIKHGNKEDTDKTATFEFLIDDDRLTITITDEGPGFEREEVANPLEPENLLKSSGRGLFLMEACMDEVVYEAGGTIVKMVKYK
ncbi:MAG: ATP-binding protein [Candidatus Poribacteria bacterium]|nr:ATP-binding protein [Candidatus Poribacteria bacterium]